jgi:translocation and assembly module TamB
VLQALDLEGSGLRADLSSPLAYRWEERSFAGPAHLQLAVDLGAVDWLAAEGVLQGTLTVETDDLQSVTFDLKGSGLRRDQFTLERIDLSGSASASAINLDLLSVQPSPERAEVVTLSGRIDLANEALALAVAGEIGPDWVNQIAGRDILAGPLRVADGAITGPWQEPRLGADLQAAVEVGGNSPLRVDGGLSWDGVDTAHWEGQMQLESTTVDLDVAFATAEESWMVQLDSLALSGGPWPPLRLREPARLTWLRAEGAWEDRLSVSDFDLSGGDTQIAGRFDGGEGLRLTGSHLSLGPAAGWLPEVLAGLEIVELQLEAPRLGPVLEGGLSLVVEEQLPDGGALRLESELLLTPSAIELTRLGLSYPEGIVLDGAVDLPLRIVPQRGPQEAGANAAGGFWPALPSWLEATDAALQGQLSAQSNAALADWLQSRTGMRLRDVAVQLVLSGTVEDPQGALEMRIAELSTGRALGGQSLPPLQGVELRAEIDDQRARVDGFRFVVNQSRVAAEASLALAPLKVPGGSSWRSVLEASTASFQLDEWRAEDWMDWLPSALRRSGEIGGSLRLEPGLRWSGQLEATGFGLRPTPTIASVDRIGGRLQFADREIRLEDAGATVGGEPVRLRGQVDLENLSQPLWSFELEGDAVPIRRSTEMLLRSDLDLRLEASDPDVPVTLSGRLGLVSSTLLIDFDPLAPRLKRGAPTQPPFFSITQAPMADWRFDLSIEGDRFMRVRSPYLRALLSADFDLTGSFAEPILLGSVRTAEAQVFFPGAKFKINEGEASIDRSQPNELRLAFNGIARKASRVIVMDVSQTLSDPMVRLESTPPLPQAELIRFLATGSTNGGVGNLGLYLGQGMLGAGSVEEGLTDRLTIDVGEETTRSGGNTLDVGFELSPHWSVEGSYDVFDAYNTDLIWTLFRR